MLSHVARRSSAYTQLGLRAAFSGSTKAKIDFFNPTDEHRSLRQMLRTFVETEVDPQALHYNDTETFNWKLYQKLGELGILGITADTEFGGSGMDAVAAVIAHGK